MTRRVRASAKRRGGKPKGGGRRGGGKKGRGRRCDIVGTKGADVLVGGPRGEVICGRGGRDR